MGPYAEDVGSKTDQVFTRANSNAESLQLNSNLRIDISLWSQWILNWTWEISALFFSFLCLMAIVAFLTAIHGRPLANWNIGNAEISPNTVISIASTLMKASILLPLAQGISQLKWTHFQQRAHPLVDLQTFDSASRGPLGALMLLFRVRGRALTATFGATLTILTLALDPFNQQILAYPVRTVVASNYTATVGSASALLPGAPGWHLSTEALMQGLFSRTFQAKHECATGNCTWPEFETLGICISERASKGDASDTLRNCSSKWYGKYALKADAPPCIGVKDQLFPPGQYLDMKRVPSGATLYKVSFDTFFNMLYSFKHVIPDIAGFDETSLHGSSSNDTGVVPPELVQDALFMLWDNDFPLMLDSIANSLTNWIRESPNAALVNGTTWEPVTFVNVAWAWLAYPAMLFTLTAMFLGISIALSLGRSDLVWKSSSLALLFHRLQGWGPKDVDVRRQKDMRKTAQQLWAHLAEDDRGSVSFVRA